MELGPQQGSSGRRARPNLKDEAASHLRDRIFSGRLRPGDRIDQDAVAEELGTSRLPVREAIITLGAEGLVNNVPRRGAFVAPLTPDDVLDHYTIYGVLCGLAAERAAHTLDSDQLAELAELNRRMRRAQDPAVQEELNYRFHQIINRAGSSRRLTAVLRMMTDSMPTRFFEFTEDWGTRAYRDHRAIIRALEAGDGDGARVAVAAHLRSGGEQGVAALRAAGFWEPAGAVGAPA